MADNKTVQGTADFDWDALALDGYTQVDDLNYLTSTKVL